MPKFGKSSRARLGTCHDDLQTLCNEVVKVFDCTVICGYRGKEEQDLAVAKGNSKAKFPKGKHNGISGSPPSLAVDILPYPIDWKNTDRMTYFAGYMMATAEILFQEGKIDHKLTWGRDWNNKWQRSNNNGTTFLDYPHFELRKAKR